VTPSAAWPGLIPWDTHGSRRPRRRRCTCWRRAGSCHPPSRCARADTGFLPRPARSAGRLPLTAPTDFPDAGCGGARVVHPQPHPAGQALKDLLAERPVRYLPRPPGDPGRDSGPEPFLTCPRDAVPGNGKRSQLLAPAPPVGAPGTALHAGDVLTGALVVLAIVIPHVPGVAQLFLPLRRYARHRYPPLTMSLVLNGSQDPERRN